MIMLVYPRYVCCKTCSRVATCIREGHQFTKAIVSCFLVITKMMILHGILGQSVRKCNH